MNKKAGISPPFNIYEQRGEQTPKGLVSRCSSFASTIGCLPIASARRYIYEQRGEQIPKGLDVCCLSGLLGIQIQFIVKNLEFLFKISKNVKNC